MIPFCRCAAVKMIFGYKKKPVKKSHGLLAEKIILLYAGSSLSYRSKSLCLSLGRISLIYTFTAAYTSSKGGLFTSPESLNLS